MRKARTIALILATALVAMTYAPPAKADVDVSFGLFYSNLSPHGSWLVSAEYGRVWQPADYSPGWNPYYDGHWVCSDVGWTWVSDYSWGGIPYHYGTWVLDPRFGWVWVPGYTWAPSWVVFRTGPDYIGWAPVPPSFSIGASFTFGDDPDMFVFVGAGDFLAPRVRTRVVPVETTRTVFRNTTIVNNIAVENDVVVNRGPDVRVVERATGQRIDVTPIERVRRVAPVDRVSKADLRVKREKGALRVAEPVRADEPLPTAERSSKRGKGRQEAPQVSQERTPRRDARQQASVERASPPVKGRDSTARSSRVQPSRRPELGPDTSKDSRMEQRGRAERQAQEPQRAETRQRAEAQQKAAARQRAESQPKAKGKTQDQKKRDRKKSEDTKDGKNR